MKPTQQQIDAALEFADSGESTGGFSTHQTLAILAAAYREKCEEAEKQRALIVQLNDVNASLTLALQP